jgi:membrane protein YdbS with pleckstrin-like domain
MRFPARVLNPGEEVILDVRPHWWYLTSPIGILLVVMAGSVAAAVEPTPAWVDWVALAALATAAAWLLRRYARWTSTRLVVTTSRLIRRTGLLARRAREIPLGACTDVSYRQTLWDRIIGAGDVLLESAGRDGQEVFPDLPHPERIQQQIISQVDELRQQVSGPPRPGTDGHDGSIAGRMGQLDDLHRRGLITDAEYAAKRAQLLDRL